MQNKRHIGKVIINLSYQLKRDFEQSAAEHGLTRTQAVIIKYLVAETKKRDVFQKDIEEDLKIRSSSVTSVLQLMEKNGYIKRESVCTDARLKKIVLTEKGDEIRLIVQNLIDEMENEVSKSITEGEREFLFYILDKLSKTISD